MQSSIAVFLSWHHASLVTLFLIVLQQSALEVLPTSNPAMLPLVTAPATSRNEDVLHVATREATATAPNIGTSTKSHREAQSALPPLDTLQARSLACCCCLVVHVVKPLPSKVWQQLTHHSPALQLPTSEVGNVTTCRLGLPSICDSEPQVGSVHAQQLPKLCLHRTCLWAPAHLTPAASALQGAGPHLMAWQLRSITSAFHPSMEARGCLATLNSLAVTLSPPMEQVRGVGHTARPLAQPSRLCSDPPAARLIRKEQRDKAVIRSPATSQLL